jgi:hypothetical protein
MPRFTGVDYGGNLAAGSVSELASACVSAVAELVGVVVERLVKFDAAGG